MRKTLFGMAVCLERPVSYYLIRDLGGYGICVEYCRDWVLLRRLSRRRFEVEALLEAMERGVVTPVTARDVAEDWFS